MDLSQDHFLERCLLGGQKSALWITSRAAVGRTWASCSRAEWAGFAQGCETGNSSITCTSIDRDNTFEATRYDFIAEASRTEAQGEVYSDVGAAMLNLSGSHKSRKLEP